MHLLTLCIFAYVLNIIYNLLHNLMGGYVDDFNKLVHDRAQ